MTDWTPSLNALRAFETVARHLNYPNSAAELHVTPAAVKQLVRKLEAAVGVKLLEKRGRGLVLTEKGEIAGRELSQAFRQITDTVENMRRHSAGCRLIVTSDPSFAMLWLLPRLDRFKRRYPLIDVLVDSSPQIADLRAGAADIAIRFGTPTDTEMVTHRLFDEQLTAYCSPLLVANGEGPQSVEDLETIPLLRWDLSGLPWASATSRWNRWSYWLDQVGASHVKPAAGTRFNDYNIALQAAIAGQGVIIGSRPILKDMIDAELLVSPIAEVVDTDVGYDLVTTQPAIDRKEVASFWDWIIEEACQ